MTSIAPPRLAAWLLRRFNVGPHADAIAGDLLEQYRSNGSRLWYWRQVLSAIVADTAAGVSANRRRAAGMLAIGSIAYVVLSFPTNAMIRTLRDVTRRYTFEETNAAREAVLWMLLAERTLLVWAACAVTGWIVGRVSRSAASVLMFAITLLLFEYGMMLILLKTTRSPAGATFPIAPAVLLIGRPISALIGGLLAVRPAETAVPD